MVNTPCEPGRSERPSEYYDSNNASLNPMTFESANNSPVSAFLSPNESSNATTSPHNSVFYEMDNYSESGIKVEDTSDFDLLVSNTHQQHEPLQPIQEQFQSPKDENLQLIHSLITVPTTPTGRKRGRPPKPKPEVEPESKRSKNRSKTGCKTCRSRKKKCDEVKPRCKFGNTIHFH